MSVQVEITLIPYSHGDVDHCEYITTVAERHIFTTKEIPGLLLIVPEFMEKIDVENHPRKGYIIRPIVRLGMRHTISGETTGNYHAAATLTFDKSVYDKIEDQKKKVEELTEKIEE